MHIAYIHYLTSDDTALCHAQQFVRAARELGHRVDIHAMNFAADSSPSQPHAHSLYRKLRTVAKTRLGRYLHEPKELLWNLLYIPREIALLRGTRPEVLLVRDHLFTISCVPVSRRMKIPLVLEMNAPADESKTFLDEYFHLPGVPRWFEAFKLRNADAVTVVSSTLKQWLIQEYSLPERKFFLAHNGADTGLFRPGVRAEEHLPWPPDNAPVVGFVGSFKKWHAIDLLRDMIKAVATSRPGTRFLLVGDGPEGESMRRLATSMHNRIFFAGRVPHARIPALVAAFQIGAMPGTLQYGCPLKLLEWMAAGKAVVAPRCPSVVEIVEDGVHGLLFEPGDAAGFTQSVLRLVDDPALRQRLGEQAALRAHSSFSWRENARRVISACEAAAARRGGTRALGL